MITRPRHASARVDRGIASRVRDHARVGLAAVALAVLFALSALAAGTASAQAPLPGPGLGNNPGPLSGPEVSLVLPAGYRLREIRGGEPTRITLACLDFDPAQPPAQCAHLRGRFSLTLVLEHSTTAPSGPISNEETCVTAPAWSGWALPSVGDAAQSLLVPIYACATEDGSITPILTIPAPADDGSVSVTVSGYCVNLEREIPGSAHTFTTGVLTDDEGLLLLVAALDGKNLYDGAAHYPVQAAVWGYTEFNQLDLALLESLAPLP